MVNLQYFVLTYVDDFMGIKLKCKVWQAYHTLENLLKDVGANEALEKAVPPFSIIEFLGTGLNLDTLMLFVTEEKMMAIMSELELWIHKKYMTR